MIETMTSKLKSWASAHLSPLKIDFMSLNRLRLNQSVESIFETNIPYTEQARKGYMDLRAYLPDLSLTLDNPKVLLNPFGRAPLFALIVFHSETPCHVSYTVQGHQEENSFSRTLTEETTVHVVPVFGLYAGEANRITVSLLDETGLLHRRLPDLSMTSLERVLSVPIEYEAVDNRIAAMAERSRAYLEGALKSIDEQ